MQNNKNFLEELGNNWETSTFYEGCGKSTNAILSKEDIFISKIPNSKYTTHDHVFINLRWYIVSNENYEIILTNKLPLWLYFDGEKITWNPKEIGNFKISFKIVDSDWTTIWSQSFNLKIDDTSPNFVY